MVVAAKVLAASAVELFTKPQIIEEAKQELSKRLGERKYRSLIPEGLSPPIDLNRKTMEKYRALMEKYYEKVG
jgi:aminobenzoyl-glutamate utilization protein B